MKLLRYIGRRLLWLIPVLLFVTLITFVITRLLPGDPVQMLLGDQATEELYAQYTEKMGLDKPIFVQYAYYIQDLLQGDWGTSYQTNNPVQYDLMKKLPATLELIIVSLTLSVIIGIGLGIFAAIKKNTVSDHIVRIVSLTGTVMPSFWFGLLLIYFLFFKLQIVPAPAGRLPIGTNFSAEKTGFMLIDTLLANRPDLFVLAIKQMALPVITMVLTTLAAICKLTRASMISSMKTEYVKMSKASGVPLKRVYGRYALKNGMLPVITSVGMTFSFEIGGLVLVEKIFSWPGVGLYAVNALSMSDYPAIQAFVLLCALSYLIVFLVVDLLYFAVDPRIKY